MTASARVRKAGLTLHVASSVGWLGAVLVYLGLGAAAVTSDDTVLVAAVYLAMDRTAWTVLVSLALAALVTGVAQEVAGDTPLSAADVALLRSPSVIVHSAGALVLLATATVLATYKPVGLTRHGQRHRHTARSARATG